MTATTPVKGLVYPVAGDSPLSLPSTFATFAGQVDTMAAGYDTDAARVSSNNMVKISVSTPTAAGAVVAWDTLEYNRGTPTDLTLYSGLQLSGGLWLVGGSKTFTGVAGNAGFEYSAYIAVISPSFSQLCARWTRDGGTALAVGTTGGTMDWPNQTLSMCAPLYVPSGSTYQLTMSIGTESNPMTYIDLWAFQIGDA